MDDKLLLLRPVTKLEIWILTFGLLFPVAPANRMAGKPVKNEKNYKAFGFLRDN